ncbi:TetR family transcriptional regulator [Nonomuraea aridisoli]|uniref:TetR family transcriptional regulator n=2 Tax=Nonomuraea aridisoli TaxID=2070368 RepID=A0A2W2EKC5_9ACTN|nr:TetR family transcriptional regulator [Nonomuraea aridisoli]
MDTRQRMLHAATDLLVRGGRDAVSTRAVSAAAGVTAPTLYRLFGDKDGLLEEVAAFSFEQYLADKQALAASDDPIADLVSSWELNVRFGLSQPALYMLMFGGTPSQAGSKACQKAFSLLREMVSRVAAAGRLRVDVDRATQLLYATGVGVVLTLLATPPTERDLELSVAARDHVMRAITTEDDLEAGPARSVAHRAIALREALRHDDGTTLTANEQALLADWLDRLAARPAAASAS